MMNLFRNLRDWWQHEPFVVVVCVAVVGELLALVIVGALR